MPVFRFAQARNSGILNPAKVFGKRRPCGSGGARGALITLASFSRVQIQGTVQHRRIGSSLYLCRIRRFQAPALEKILHRPLFGSHQAAVGLGDSHRRAVDVDEGFVVADGPFRRRSEVGRDVAAGTPENRVRHGRGRLRAPAENEASAAERDDAPDVPRTCAREKGRNSRLASAFRTILSHKLSFLS